MRENVGHVIAFRNISSIHQLEGTEVISTLFWCSRRNMLLRLLVSAGAQDLEEIPVSTSLYQ